MAIVEQVTCDVCGKLKGDVNHWWLAHVKDFIRVEPWAETLSIGEFKHLCGQECVIQAVNRWMGENSK